jgi:hypothetical protein
LQEKRTQFCNRRDLANLINITGIKRADGILMSLSLRLFLASRWSTPNAFLENMIPIVPAGRRNS